MDEALLAEPAEDGSFAPMDPQEDPGGHRQDEELFGDPEPTVATGLVAPDHPVMLNHPVAPAAAPLALYRRYRPDRFADVIGQEHVTAPLQRALTNNRVNHAYLFSGPRGCGKTTSARILARALNCEQGPIAEPCGECQSCRDLARGGPGSIDVIEIDAASHGGVDDARDLRERAFFAPVSSRYKIYIVDEAHMVTTAGFNALLKLVEEPPPHVKFIFATTEPDKVIGTIRSRTHHYPFRLVPPRVLTDYLGQLCVAEGIEVEPVVLPLVVRAGAGSVRDSLSVLDQLLGGAEEGGVTYRQATALLGYTPDSLLDEFVDAFAAGDAGGVFSCVDKVIEVGQDPRRFAEDLLRRLRDLVIVAAVPDALVSGLVDVAPDQAERLSSQVSALGGGELTRAAEVIAAGLTDMRGTTAPRLHLELMCARVLLPGADVDDRGVHARLDRLERRIGMSGRSEASGEAAARPQPAPVANRGSSPGGDQAPGSVARPGGAVPGRPTPDPAQPSSGQSPSTPRPSSFEPSDQSPSDQSPSERSPSDQSPSDQPLVSSEPMAPEEDETPPVATDDQDYEGPAGGESDDTSLGSQAAEAGSPPGALTVTDVRRLWPEVLEEVKGKRRFTWVLLSQNAQVAEVRNGVLLLSMPNAGARDSFSRGGSDEVLHAALVAVLGVSLKIESMVNPVSGGTAPAPAPRSVADTAAASWGSPARAMEGEPGSGGSGSGGSSSAGSGSGESGSSGPGPTPAPPSDPALRGQARQSIRPTRPGGTAGPVDDRDAVATRDDSDLEESAESHTELLARHLGAEIIAVEEDGA